MKKKILIIIISASLVVGMIAGYFVGRHIKIEKEDHAQYVCEVIVRTGYSLYTVTYWVDPAFNENPKYYTALQYETEHPLWNTPEKEDITCFAVDRR